MAAIPHDTKTLLNVAGVAAIVYLVPKPGEISQLQQTFQQVKANFVQDQALAAAAVADIFIKINSYGLVNTTFAADVYGWFNSLTPEQQQAVRDAENNGALGQAASNTLGELAAGVNVTIRWAAVALIAYGLIRLNTASEAA